MNDQEASIEGCYHSALEACAYASQLESESRFEDALNEYRRSIGLIETMRRSSHSGRDVDEAYLSGADDVEGICRVHIAKLEGELPTLRVPFQGNMRRKSTESLKSMTNIGLTRAGSVPPRKEVSGHDKWGYRDRVKPSRSPSPEKKEKKSMPLSLRPSGVILNRQPSADSTNASLTAIEASRAAALAWQGKRTNGAAVRVRNSSPTSSRGPSLDYTSELPKRPSVSDTMSLLDAPLIDFSAPTISSSTLPTNESMPNLQLYTPIYPTPNPPPPPLPQHTEMHPPPRRKPPPVPSKQQLGRSNATITRSSNALRPPASAHPRSNSAPNLIDPQPQQESPPISVSISSEISPEQELSREEKALKDLKGVDETLAKTILNDIVVRGDEVRWEDIGTASLTMR